MSTALRRLALAALVTATALAGGCATEGRVVDAGVYGAFYYDDPWYWAGCCVDPPDAIGPPPPRPEHPIANPPPARPAHPIATPPRPMPAPRPMAMPRGGGRR